MKIGGEKHRLSTDVFLDVAAAFAKVCSGTFDTALGAVAGTTIGLGAGMAHCLVAGPQLVGDPVEPAAMGGMVLGAAAGLCLSIIGQARHVHSVRLLESLAYATNGAPEIMEKEIDSVRLWKRETMLGSSFEIKPAEFKGGGQFSNPQPVTFARLLEDCREHDYSCMNAVVKAELDRVPGVALAAGAAVGFQLDAQARKQRKAGPR